MKAATRRAAGVCFKTLATNASCRSPKKAPVFAGAVRFRRICAEVVDVVEHQKKRVAIFKSIIIRAKNPLKGIAAVTGARRLEIQIVVAGNVPPGKPDLSDDPV